MLILIAGLLLLILLSSEEGRAIVGGLLAFAIGLLGLVVVFSSRC